MLTKNHLLQPKQGISSMPSVCPVRYLLFVFTLFFFTANVQAQTNKKTLHTIEAAGITADTGYLFKLIREDPLYGQLSWLEMTLEPFVFNTSNFPTAVFKQPAAVERALGPYTISAVYYNAAQANVSTATTDGRYGAVVTVRFASGVTMNRYYTLYHYSGDFSKHLDWWRWAAKDKAPLTFTLPPILGINSNVAGSQSDVIGRFMRFGFFENLQTRHYAARMLAGMSELTGTEDPATLEGDVIVKDRQWWLGLKKKLYPLVPQFNISGPSVSASAPGTVLSTSNVSLANISLTTQAQLDNLLANWSATANEALGVMLVRNGQIFYHKAFGNCDGITQTVATKSHIASVNKTLTGILLMMCVDRKLISLDQNISLYLPGLRSLTLTRPITIRHLMTHVSGLPDLTLDEANDLEEVIKPILPHITVGGAFNYSETGYSLLGKILENVTGKTFAHLMRDWLIKPLNLQMDIRGAASDAWSTPADLAVIGQLLLNKGTYNNVRYFSDTTYYQMTPNPPATGQGIGLQVYAVAYAALKDSQSPVSLAILDGNTQAGFSNLLGHGASTGTIFAIDPPNKLVVVMTRNRMGANFQANASAFLNIIGKGMQH
jgi:CubicO group peptidase (beta-lactamase class C family)